MKNPKGLWYFLAKVMSNDYRKSFFVELGVDVLLAKFGIYGRAAHALGFFVKGFMGLALEVGVFKIDITLDAIKEGKKLKNFDRLALEAYERTIKRVYTEEEKNEIRKIYLNIISDFGPVK